MRTHAFLICGYGVPKKIEDDLHYTMYLRIALNQVVDALLNDPKAIAVVIPSGGPTDMRKPYKRTEAGEMKKYLEKMLKQAVLKSIRSRLTIIEEKKALSTMENVLYFKRVLSQRAVRPTSVTIFCEWTRRKKLTVLSRKVFGSKANVRIVAIDFDQSSNRYLDPAFIAKKERTDIRLSLKALSSKKYFQEYRKALKRKFDFLRKAGPDRHPEAVRAFWQQELKRLEEL